MPKCGECREFPKERGVKCALRWASGEEPEAGEVREACPCFHPAGEPTEGEMLDWAIEAINQAEHSACVEYFMNFTPIDRAYITSKIKEMSRSAIREAMKGGKG